MPLLTIGLKHINNLPPIHKGPLRPLVGIMAHLLVSDLFIYPFIPIGDDEYASFGPKSFEVHPTNSQSVPLPMISFEYVNGLLPIHKGPLKPMVGIMAHLVVSDLLICPFSFKELTHT